MESPVEQAPGTRGPAPLLTGAAVSLLGLALCAFLLGMRHPSPEWTRAALEVLLPDRWLVPGEAVGLRFLLVLFAVAAFAGPTWARRVLLRAAARSDDPHRHSTAVYGLTVLRMLLLAEAVVLYVDAPAIVGSAPEEAPGGLWLLTAFLPWTAFLAVLLLASAVSVYTARQRAAVS